jgi:hypothetical protein
MQVSRYQMNNVLECFGRKLSRMHKNEKPAPGVHQKCADEQALSAESSRQATMAKFSRQVLERVTDAAALSLSREKGSPESPLLEEGAAAAEEPGDAEFTFNVIDAINRKRTSRLAMGGPAALIRRLEPVPEKPTESKTESWA